MSGPARYIEGIGAVTPLAKSGTLFGTSGGGGGFTNAAGETTVTEQFQQSFFEANKDAIMIGASVAGVALAAWLVLRERS